MLHPFDTILISLLGTSQPSTSQRSSRTMSTVSNPHLPSLWRSSSHFRGRARTICERSTDGSIDIFVDNVHIELSLWDTAGQEEFDRLRSLSYDDTHAIMLCFSVDSKDSLENVESKWVGEIADNCQGVKLVLVALKCDLREQGADDEVDENGQPKEKKEMINYNQGLEVARRINALRYLECSAMKNRGVNEAFTEAARVALSVKPNGGKDDSKCNVM